MNNYKGPLNSKLGIAKIPPAVNQNIQNLASQVASTHPYRAPNINGIVPAPPENAREQTPYPYQYQSISIESDSAKNNSMSNSGVLFIETNLYNGGNENDDDEKSNSRSESPSGDISLAEIALAMEVNEKNKNGKLVQNYFIPENLGR